MARASTAKKKRVTFKLDQWPDADDVRLVGSFNNWDPEARSLKQNSSGVWSTWMMLEPGRYEYRYVVDGTWRNDPEADHCPNAYGGQNCLLVVS